MSVTPTERDVRPDAHLAASAPPALDTPSLYLNGKEVPSTAVSDITELEKLIAEASGS